MFDNIYLKNAFACLLIFYSLSSQFSAHGDIENNGELLAEGNNCTAVVKKL
jgi:hypothetical protein